MLRLAALWLILRQNVWKSQTNNDFVPYVYFTDSDIWYREEFCQISQKLQRKRHYFNIPIFILSDELFIPQYYI